MQLPNCVSVQSRVQVSIHIRVVSQRDIYLQPDHCYCIFILFRCYCFEYCVTVSSGLIYDCFMTHFTGILALIVEKILTPTKAHTGVN